MDDHGVFFRPDGVRFERRLPGPVARVWTHLTDPTLLAQWFAPGTVAQQIGGAVSFRFDLDEGGPAEEGVVTDWSPPHRLAFQWARTGAEVVFELHADGEAVRLILTETRLPPQGMAEVAGGWHAFLDALGACLAGDDPTSAKAAWLSFPEVYRRRFEP